MKFEEIKKLANEDAKINQIDLDDEALRTSILHQKWLDILHGEVITLKRCEDEMKKLQLSLWLYYSGKADKEVYDRKGAFNLNVQKGELNMFIESDDDYLKTKEKIDNQREKVAYIESVIKNINSRQWSIRNAIEWRKITQCQVQ